MDVVTDVCESLREEIERVCIGNENNVDWLYISVATKGHVLLEGPPGVAKTTVAQSLANLAAPEYKRTQMMPDLLPSDVTGTNVCCEEPTDANSRRVRSSGIPFSPAKSIERPRKRRTHRWKRWRRVTPAWVRD